MITQFLHRSPVETRGATVVVSDHAWQLRGVKQAFAERHGMQSIIAGDLGLETILAALPQQLLTAVVMDASGRQGLEAIRKSSKQIASIRKLHPHCPVIFMVTSMDGLDARSLPPRTYVTNNATTALNRVEAEFSAMGERSWARRNGHRHPTQGGISVTARPLHQYRFPLPNFNIKHPAMLVPIALAAVRSGTQLFCEISPRESYLFYGGNGAQRVHHVLSAAFKALRTDLAEVETATGASLRLHLDHADDLDIIRLACDAGFDSIMADVSARSLSQNILFTRSAAEIIRPYGCAVEGEIGSLDNEEARKWSHTNLRDFETFVSEADLDFVGVSVGQFHGFDYGFTKTRQFLEQRSNDIEANTSRRHYAMAQAFSVLDTELDKLGLPSTALERRQLQQWGQDFLHKQSALSVEDFFTRCSEQGSVRLIAMADRLAELYFETSLGHARARANHWEKVLTYRQNESRKAVFVNHRLLQSCSHAISDTSTRLVIHGGSSLHSSDLGELHRYHVARVNFGTTVFAQFLGALSTQFGCSSRRDGEAISPPDDYRRLMAFLDEATADWKTWLIDPPEFLNPFVDWIAENIITPLRADVSVEGPNNAI